MTVLITCWFYGYDKPLSLSVLFDVVPLYTSLSYSLLTGSVLHLQNVYIVRAANVHHLTHIKIYDLYQRLKNLSTSFFYVIIIIISSW